jgi:hypothetical protein
MPRPFDLCGYYILIGKLPVPEPDGIKWANWLERAFADNSRVVGQDHIGGIFISTVFLGLDHSLGGPHPMLFETMVFRGGNGDECMRCETWDEAEKQHAAMVAKLRAEIKGKVNL